MPDTGNQAAMADGARLVADARGDVDLQLGALRGQLASLGARWNGVDAQAFRQVMIRWDEDASRIIGALSEFEARLSTHQQQRTA